MAEPTKRADRRAEHVSISGFLIQLVCTIGLFVAAFWGDQRSDTVVAAGLLSTIGLPIWISLFLVQKQQRRARLEQLETKELERVRDSGASTSLFDLAEEELHLELNKLRWLSKWWLPATTVFVVLMILLYQLLGLWSWTLENAFLPAAEGGVSLTASPTLMMGFVAFFGFISLLFAWYTLALAKMREWRLLHAGATSMFGTTIACLAVLVGLMTTGTIEWVEPLVAVILRVALYVIGLELAINFILDFYRPRTRRLIAKPSFDSRLLSLLSEPGGFAKSIADAMNYQFGFEVSATWFYQLMHRWMLPLVACTIIIVLLLSSVVVVDAQEEVVIERFGKRLGDPLTPGIALKMPYPIDIAYRAPVKRISAIVVGEPPHHEGEQESPAILWTDTHDHIVAEMMLLVASADPAKANEEDGGAASGNNAQRAAETGGVSLLMVSLPIEYRIKDTIGYLTNYQDPAGVLEHVAYQILSDHAASIDIDELIGPGREEFNRTLKSRLQERIDELDLGIELVFVGLEGAHPPAQDKVASAYQSVITAEMEKEKITRLAESVGRGYLTKVAGSVEMAESLYAAILAREALERTQDPDPEALAQAKRTVEDLLTRAGGEVALLIAQARAKSSFEVSREAAKASRFKTEVAQYQAAPLLYENRKRLEVWERLDGIPKYLFVDGISNVTVVYSTGQERRLDEILTEATRAEAPGANR